MRGKKITTEEFISESRKRFGEKFKYKSTIYKSANHSLTIECPHHGIIRVYPRNHLKSELGCPQCVHDKKTSDFVKKSKKKFGDKFKYDQTVFRRSDQRLKIECPVHQIVEVYPLTHLRAKIGCPECDKHSKDITYEQFEKVCTEKYGGKYTYIRESWKGLGFKVSYICGFHGEKSQYAFVHYRIEGNTGCDECLAIMRQKNNQQEFLRKAIEKHGSKFDYSAMIYRDSVKIITLICPAHGEFKITPSHHLQSEYGCQKCGEDMRSMKGKTSFQRFTEQANKKYGNRYRYIEESYTDGSHNVSYICPDHGEVTQNASFHLADKNKYGCAKCGTEGGIRVLPFEEFLKRAIKTHGDKYEYSVIDYKDLKTNTLIFCKVKDHGWFPQVPQTHIDQRSGCPKCSKTRPLTTELFIQKAREVHGERYNYSKTRIIGNNKEKCIITCLEHGDFLQNPNNHLNNVGCPDCAEYGFNPSDDAWFYLMKRPGEQQIGITNNFKKRIETHQRNGWDLLDWTKETSPGKIVLDTEKLFKRWLKEKVGLIQGTTENWFTNTMEVKTLAELKAKSGIATDLF